MEQNDAACYVIISCQCNPLNCLYCKLLSVLQCALISFPLFFLLLPFCARNMQVMQFLPPIWRSFKILICFALMFLLPFHNLTAIYLISLQKKHLILLKINYLNYIKSKIFSCKQFLCKHWKFKSLSGL